ncbi:MAG: hypothetical protein HQM01_06715 [Magnetococcales bacterium]|nr:hypothetical protein [Magnetococcales bacterium]
MIQESDEQPPTLPGFETPFERNPDPNMQKNERASTGVRKAFFENTRWLVLNVLFLQLRPEQGEPIALTSAEESAITSKRLELA